MALPVGSKAPDFTLICTEGDNRAPISLSQHQGKDNVVLLFVPAAFSSVCTEEFCTISEGMNSYKDLGSVVYGISVDSFFAQAAWAKQAGIGIPLLCDYTHKTVEAYDVVLPEFAGMGPGSKRAVYVINKEGVITYCQVTDSPGDLPDFDAIKQAVEVLN